MEGKIRAGELLLITSGEYSSYEVHTLVRIVKDCDLNVELEEYLSIHPGQREHWAYDHSRFLGWLSARHLFEEVEYREFFIGSDGILPDVKLSPDMDYGRSSNRIHGKYHLHPKVKRGPSPFVLDKALEKSVSFGIFSRMAQRLRKTFAGRAR